MFAQTELFIVEAVMWLKLGIELIGALIIAAGILVATSGLLLADVDGDAKLDVIVAVNGSAKRVYLNAFDIANSQNPFDGVTATSVGAGTDATTTIAVGDVDGDGDLDLFAGNNAQPNRIYRNGIKVTRFAVASGRRRNWCRAPRA